MSRICKDDLRSHAPPERIVKKLDVRRHSAAGTEVWTLSPMGAGTRPKVEVIYLHGGSFVFGITKHHWRFLARLVAATGATVHAVLYPRAPRHQHRATLSAIAAAFQQIKAQQQAETLLLMGDSAGGTLSLLLGASVKAQADGLILISPCVDLSLSNQRIADVEPHDPWLERVGVQRAIGMWLGSTSPMDPSVNPLFADLNQLPPTQLFIGGRDICFPDCVRLSERLHAIGRQVTLHQAPRMCHVWPLLPVPEARAAEHLIHELVCNVRGHIPAYPDHQGDI